MNPTVAFFVEFICSHQTQYYGDGARMTARHDEVVTSLRLLSAALAPKFLVCTTDITAV